MVVCPSSLVGCHRNAARRPGGILWLEVESRACGPESISLPCGCPGLTPVHQALELVQVERRALEVYERVLS